MPILAEFYYDAGDSIYICKVCKMEANKFTPDFMARHKSSCPVAETINELRKITRVLGPEATCECAGCAWETNETLRILREIGINYEDVVISRSEERRLKAVLEAPPHDPEKERLGNAKEDKDVR